VSVTGLTNTNLESMSKVIQISNYVKLDGFNLPTLFGETEDLTNFESEVDDFQYSDLFDENGEVWQQH